MSEPVRLAIVGMGKMGHALAELAPSRGLNVVARLDEAETRGGITRESLGGADVAVEFTAPDAAESNIRGLVQAGCPVVVGTTGWYDALPALSDWVRNEGGALLTATNFSVGVNIFEQVLVRGAELLARAGDFDAHMMEIHHSAKKDAPSGTARTLADSVERAWGRPIPITSVRTGSVPGTHEMIFDSRFETIQLAHVARDRRVFAEGALLAARWLIGRKGIFTFKDILAPE